MKYLVLAILFAALSVAYFLQWLFARSEIQQDPEEFLNNWSKIRERYFQRNDAALKAANTINVNSKNTKTINFLDPSKRHKG
ncbi:hypothetical protein EHR03_13020 [Leptospira mayottensis]|uniref:Uncharacterized protein n=1 Tax=Leptospira mayottensis 200901116 TaxID=1192864 RepID=M6UZX4_9LEPT|nr:hypothetical protein [Leptospira mayottensis]AVH81589.1 hypothetical protein [Leptospira mayottensis 200901116]TGN00346.1 hypothetical protein EHR03_13020 [Leptospira mayottensis]